MDQQEKLEQELRDERARRRDAENRLEELADRAEVWRQRAEERTERIERLLAAQQRKGHTLRRWVNALKGETATPLNRFNPEPSAPAAPTQTRWPTQKAVTVVSAVSNVGMERALAGFDNSSLHSARESDLDRADFVVVEPSALARVDDRARERLTGWAAQSGRQRLIFWASDDALSPVAGMQRDDDVVVAFGKSLATKMGVEHLPGCFDPAAHNPGGTESRAPLDLGDAELTIIESAASGRGVTDDPQAGTAARRWAYRNHAPWVRASRLRDLVGVSAHGPLPGMAAVLVSHRPASVPAAIEAVARQTHRPLELIVGLHGAAVTPEIERALSASGIPSEVLTFDSQVSFGECLNLVAEQTTAPLLTKIDDDDHYGPAHLEDSFHALCYSGADIVGKGAHYTYIARPDTTVLRHPDMEETFIDGSPNGATLVFHRETWDRVGFPHRPRHVDTGFLRAARGDGATVYATTRWEFCYVRNQDGHTWDAEEAVFLTGADDAWDGFHPERVEVADVHPI